jgi:hypothetical protein
LLLIGGRRQSVWNRHTLFTPLGTYIVLMATAYLVHGVWLMADYNATPASHRTATAMQQRFWVLATGQVFFAAMFVYVYTRGFARKSYI